MLPEGQTEIEDRADRICHLPRSNKDLFAALGTHRHGRRAVRRGSGLAPDAFETVDVLFVDEAAQMSLANVLAVSQAAKTVVLIGDPQQLDQPMQGSHPEGTDVSALDHILGGEQTISPDKGLFLEETWRLHPEICAFTSELFYDGKLRSRDGLEQQVINAAGPIYGSGLALSARHPPRATRIVLPKRPMLSARLSIAFCEAMRLGSIGRVSKSRSLSTTLSSSRPTTRRCSRFKQRLPGARVGTVDKFQGQETPIAIYSTATSSQADAPRGMEFLYSLNRLNVATSRAKCISIMVGSPELFKTDSRTPRQAQLANAFCRYLELAHPIAPN